ncbi:3-deoxy-manno-octulosonate cytidylyltransferase [Bermanella sp. WJH001]|uniref:3-deoxy-manno-octulosonate cytidylyltransferase n=1 Tax=Bermanella sp. WJH001 TaxID=3048005 RepID=UPI0024BDAD97|nr:3-deoxy-manno-octulosonate cytidylyltransferase [Bermanella sp. WJH001]MDJ1537105.1 3-deoxy-manno-octulosonate cytidylyltransferase [Bermanella sp. WJH001]
MSDYKIVIPARYGSSRLPGKPLIELAGKPMVQHVYERALATGISDIVIATDDQRIYDVAIGFGAQVIMTSVDHENGTERIAEVAKKLGWHDDDVIVNVQGDEPLIPRELIELTAKGLLDHPEAGMSSLCTPITSAEDAFDPNAVKAVLDNRGFAMYFSRAPIPWDRDLYKHGTDKITEVAPVFRHIGMYGYRVSFLKQYSEMEMTALEQAECLEQLRALCYGVKIHMGVIDQPPGHGVDTPADVARVEAQLINL